MYACVCLLYAPATCTAAVYNTSDLPVAACMTVQYLRCLVRLLLTELFHTGSVQCCR